MLGLRALVFPPTASSWRHPRLGLAVSLALIGLLVAGGTLSYVRSLRVPRLIPGLKLQSSAVGSIDHDQLDPIVRRIAAQHLEQPIVLRVDSHELAVSRRRLGVRVDVAATVDRLRQLGKSGDLLQDLVDRVRARRGQLDVPLAASLHRNTAWEYLAQLKTRVDRPAVAARLDLERGKVTASSDGYRLPLHAALATAEVAVRQGATSFVLPVLVTTPKDGDAYANLDISQVLGEHSTVYSLADKDADRAFNLRVAASKLDGQVLAPGARLSFNKVVGPRTSADGYRTAPVIDQGELVDGMAGGACQLSSTLFAASFFAGLDLVSSRPHTIPSSYIRMGLDAAVAYPATDLVIGNPYDFPVAVHFRVSQGQVTVQIRGRQRPWRMVTFNRKLLETTPFKEVLRDDPALPRGVRLVAQAGVPGFVLERERSFFGRGPTAIKTEKREIRYPPTTQIILRGTGKPDPSWKRPPEPKPFGKVPETFTISR